VLIGITELVAPDRRRMAVVLALWTAGLLVLFRAIARTAGARVVAQVADPRNRDAAKQTVDAVLHSYLTLTLGVVVFALVLALVAYLAGPGRGAVAIRSRVSRVDWIAERAVPIGAAVAVVALGIAVFVTLTWAWLLVLVVIVAAIEIALWRIRVGAGPRTDVPTATA
jgi:hypothetical protein